MSSNGFNNKWIQSSRGLPGSFMNENHHTMTHIWKGDDNRQKGMISENQTSATPNYMNREQEHDHQTQQSNEMGALLGQEPQRSILGPHNGQFQSQQTDFPDDSDFYSRPKKNFDLPITAGGVEKTSDIGEELGDDPDPATKAAFQSATKPIMTSNKSSEAPSVATSFDSNRAIKNQPLVSNPIDENAYDDDADYYTTSELMPATYVEDNDDSQHIEKPTNASQQDQVTAAGVAGIDDVVPKQALDKNDVHDQDMVLDNIKNTADGSAPNMEKTASLLASDMYHQQQKDQDLSNNNQQQQQELSSSSLRGDNTIQNSLGGIGDKYKNQEPATKQPGRPFAQQGDTAKINNKQANLQQATESDTRYIPTNDQIPKQQSNPNTLSLPNDGNSSNKVDSRRRSSLTQSIGKLFGRHHKSS